jgi:hypothetical protein
MKHILEENVSGKALAIPQRKQADCAWESYLYCSSCKKIVLTPLAFYHDGEITMYHRHRHRLPSFFFRSRFILSMCGLLLAGLLAACSLGGGSTGTVSTTTSGKTPATSHATATPAQTTSASAAALAIYTGDGFTIGSPTGWTIDKASSSAASVIFIDPTRTIEFIVTVTPNPNANSATSAALDPRLHSMQSKPHYQQVDLAPTTTVGGETWDQIGAIGDLRTYSGQTLSSKVIALASNHPAQDANTKMYIIQFSAPTKDFDHMNSTTFQPMLQSFKFI